MKTNNYFLNMMTLVMITVLSVALTSCDDDDYTDNVSIQEKELKQYSWTSSNNYDLMFWGDEEISFSKQSCTLYFLGEGAGIGKYCTKEADSYFGSSTDVSAFSFSYSINGSSITINNRAYVIRGDQITTKDGKEVFSKNSPISYNESEWIESAKYYVMPDEKRLDFDYFNGCEEISTYNYSGNTKRETVISLFFGVKATEKVKSRGISSITATYSVSGGSFGSKVKDAVIGISADKDYDKFTTATVVTKPGEKATVKASFYMYDSKKKKEVHIGDATYTVPQNITDNEKEDKEEENKDESAEGNGALTGTINGHEYVDLGLSVKWATCNVGAESPTQYGNYFAFGRFKQDDNYSWYGLTEKKNGATACISGTDRDTAKQLWGKQWRMPTIEEIEELADNCKASWTKKNGISGCLLTSKINNQSIFIPAGGEYFRNDYSSDYNYSLTDNGKVVIFMSGSVKYINTYNESTYSGTIGEYAYGGYFKSGYKQINTIGRQIDAGSYGYHYKNNIRPVSDK